MVETYSFGTWIKQRRKEMRLTQRELALQAACAVATIKKIEADERRPSVEIAELLADGLSVPANWRERFVACARGQLAVDTLANMGTGTETDSTRLLPTPPTAFVGREDELAEIERLLTQPECRLVTLVGPGGIGKTRLSIETAYRLRDIFEDGTVFVPLAAVTQSSAIPTTIIRSMNLSLSSEEQLLNALKQLQILLVLDNCEQLGSGIAWFTKLLDQVPTIKILATSRERLQLRGEWVFNVPEMTQQQAVELLQNSGKRMVSDLTVLEADAASICQVVDNLPLAVELAAGWLNFMTCEQIVQSIQRDVDFLATNMRDIPERHRSIRAVFDYSWKMLSEQEQNVLMRLSVFRGGWRAEEANTVAGANILLLRALVEKSLIRSTGNGRYDLHELIRQYAAEKLRDSGLEAITYEQHAEVYIQFCNDTLASNEKYKSGQMFVLIETELDNCRTALRWSLDNGRVETALRLLSATFVPWLRRGHWVEGERWHREALQFVGEEKTTWICQVFIHLGTFIAVQGRFAEAFPFSAKGKAMMEEVNDTEATIAVAEQSIQSARSLDEARMWFEKYVEVLENWDHPMKKGRLSTAYCFMGDRLRDDGQIALAKDYYHKALEIDHDLHGMMSVYTIGNLGRIAFQEGDDTEALNRINESVTTMRSLGNRVGTADWTVRLGEVLLYRGDVAQAKIHFEESLALFEEIQNVRGTADLQAFLAHTALLQNDWDELVYQLQLCLPLYKRILQQFRSLASDHSAEYTLPFVNALFCTALLCANREQYEEATTILGCATLLREKDLTRPEPQLQARVEETIANLRKYLGTNRYSTLIEKGRSLTVSEILDFSIDCLPSQ